MTEQQHNQKMVELSGNKATVWNLTNTASSITYKGLLLENGNLFVPVNGGKSGIAEFDELATSNAEVTLQKEPNPYQTVAHSFGLLGVITNVKRGDICAGGKDILHVSGIILETHGDFIVEMAKSYPDIKIEPVFANG